MAATTDIEIENRSIGDFIYPEKHTYDAGIGLSEDTVHYISDVKEEPEWIRKFRLKALQTFSPSPCRPIGRPRTWTTSTSTTSAITWPGPRPQALLG
jgi:hypothetical protein